MAHTDKHLPNIHQNSPVSLRYSAMIMPVTDSNTIKLYVTCVCGTRDVSVDRLTTRVCVETNKLVSDEIQCFSLEVELV